MKPLHRIHIVWIFCLLTCYHPGFSQYDFKWQTDGTVNSAVISNNILYIGGSFSYVGSYKGNMVAVDNVTGEWNDGWPVANSRVNVIIPDGAGGWYIGGSFTQVGGLNRAGVAHLLPDKTVDNSWDGKMSGGVRCMFLHGGILYVGGSFTMAGNQPRSNIAAYDATGNVTSFNPGTNSIVRTMTTDGSTIYVGGDFTTIGGQPRSRLAAMDLGGAVTAWDPNPFHGSGSASVNAMVINGSTVYIGGFFTNVGGQPRSNIAALDATVNTNNATAWNPNANGSVECLLLSGNTLYAGGFFTNIGGQTRRRIAQLDILTNTNNALAWDPNAGGAVLSLYKTGNILYAGGQFTTISGQARRKLAALDVTINTNNVTSWDPNTGNGWELYAILPAGNSILAGGSFTSVNGQYRNNIAAIDLVNNVVLPWNPNANGNINVVKVDGNTVYAGGDFTSIGGQTRNRIAALDAMVNTNNALAWNPNASNSVRAIAIAGGIVYAGGDFTTIGGQARNRMAALDASGAATAWNPDANATIRAIDARGGVIYAGGDFTSIGGQLRNRIAALDATINTNNATAWNPNAGNIVRTIAVTGTEIYAGGDFTTIGGQPRNRIAALDAAGNATAWRADANGTIRSIALVNRVLYTAGDFNIIGTQGRFNVAAISMDANTNNVLAWNPLPGVTSMLNTITVSGPYAYVGGGFTASAATLSFFLGYMPSLDLILANHSIWFAAEKQDDRCVLRWSQREEAPGTLYEVQRSSGNALFTKIAEQPTANRYMTGIYEITDILSGPGTYYYRIKVIPPSGQSWYSPARMIHVAGKVVSIASAQAGHVITLIASGGRYTFNLYGNMGQLLAKRPLQQGSNSIPAQSLHHGIYYYTIHNGHGNILQSGRLVLSVQ